MMKLMQCGWDTCFCFPPTAVLSALTSAQCAEDVKAQGQCSFNEPQKRTTTADLQGSVGQHTHPAVLVDGPEPFHSHISDMAPPEQDLPWNKAGKTDLES